MFEYKLRLRGNLGYQDYRHTDLMLDPRYQIPSKINNFYYNMVENYQSGADLKRIEYDGVSPYQRGAGIGLSDVKKVVDIVQKGKDITQKGLAYYSSPEVTLAKNMWGTVTNNNPKWRPGFEGEKHMLTTKGITYNW